MRDVDQEPDSETTYECFSCGTLVQRVSNPEACPDCGGSMRNRMMPME
jgi:rubrerythrin